MENKNYGCRWFSSRSMYRIQWRILRRSGGILRSICAEYLDFKILFWGEYIEGISGFRSSYGTVVIQNKNIHNTFLQMSKRSCKTLFIFIYTDK